MLQRTVCQTLLHGHTILIHHLFHLILELVERSYARFGSNLCTGGIGTSDKPPIGDGERVPRTRGRDVLCPEFLGGSFDSRTVPALDGIEYTLLNLTLCSEARDFLARDDIVAL